MGLGINEWDLYDAILCVAFIKPKRKHHSLQLNIPEWVRPLTSGGHVVYHKKYIGGRSIPFSAVLEALVEACREDMVVKTKEYDGKIVKIGKLPSANLLTWRNSQNFLANLFHYSLIRSNLRESKPYKHSQET